MQQIDWNRVLIDGQRTSPSSRIGIPGGYLDEIDLCLNITTVV